MTFQNSYLQRLEAVLLTDKVRERGEKIILCVAIGSFVIHLLLITLTRFGLFGGEVTSELLQDPIAAIYTPFSFILIYEVYLLVFYLPQSITKYIGKQYEIILLIVIRRIFKDMGNLELTTDWFKSADDLQFTYDIVGTIILFLLITVFYRLAPRPSCKIKPLEAQPDSIRQFVSLKTGISIALTPLLAGLAIFSLSRWIYENLFSVGDLVAASRDVNQIFFEDFFTILILADVFLLLFSFLHSNEFSTVIRNSGFVISTILIKISFSATGLLNVSLIVSAVLFGVVMLWIHNFFNRGKTKAIEFKAPPN